MYSLNNKLLSRNLSHIRFNHCTSFSDIYVQYIFISQLQIWGHHCWFESVSWGVKCVLSSDPFLNLPSVDSASGSEINKLDHESARIDVWEECKKMVLKSTDLMIEHIRKWQRKRLIDLLLFITAISDTQTHNHCLKKGSMNKPLQVSGSNFSASFAKICKINLLTCQSNNNCFEIINIHMNKFLLINNITGSATVMSHSQKQIITKSVGHSTTGVFQTHCDNQFLQTKRT